MSRTRDPLRALAAALAAALAWCAPPLAWCATPASGAGGPLRSDALWIAKVPEGAGAAQLAAQAGGAGVRTLFIKAGEGSGAEAQFTPALVSGLRAAGLSVCAWTFVYGTNPRAEAAVAAGAAAAGAQCLVVDAESQYDGRYGAAQIFTRALRARVGGHFQIGLAGEAEVLAHPRFPYSVFLGPGAFNVDEPQIYWRDFGVGVDAAFAASIPANAIYDRPIAPVGQLYGSPAPAEVARFRALAVAYGCPGTSFFDLDSATPELLAALLEPPPTPLARIRAAAPTVRAGADGDEVVWAQELLNAAGAHLPVGGFFGAATARALARFQARHHLTPNGVLGAATWRALQRLRAREPSWAKHPPDSAR